MKKYFYLLVVYTSILFPNFIFGQSITLGNAEDEQSIELSQLIQEVERQTQTFFSYNANQVDVKTILFIPQGVMELNDILLIIQDSTGLQYEYDRQNKKIILSGIRTGEFSGILKDSISGESIPGALIVANNRYLAASDANGYFKISLNDLERDIEIYNIGYSTKVLNIAELSGSNNEVLISPLFELDIEIIGDQSNAHIYDSKLSIADLNNHYGAAGGSDLVEYIKYLPGVSNGTEGQNGFNVRGGGPHQNLILVDGMPIYEASHLGGVSSIFLKESIKSIDFYKSGQPSSYGGRLSSVLDVRLDDGNRNKIDKQVSIGLEGITSHFDGPLGSSTSFNVNLRASGFELFASPLVKRFTDVDDISLSYIDGYFKLSHWFSNTNKISISSYAGSDVVGFSRNKFEEDMTGYRDFNELEWGNRFVTLRWDALLNNRWNMSLQLGRTKYNYKSRGSYNIKYFDSDTLRERSFDIYSVSDLTDDMVNMEFSKFTDILGRVKLGFNYTSHKNDPFLKESDTYYLENIDPPGAINDTTYFADQYTFYIEDHMGFDNGLSFNIGLRNSYYVTELKDYFLVEPRVKIDLIKELNHWSLSYSRMSQFVHLLSNPGPGIPSDLWVPSTSVIKPEISHNLSLDFLRNDQFLQWQTSLWYKNFDNLIEYSNPSALIYSLIINNELYQVEADNENWEDRVSLGKGFAYGIEFGARKTIAPFTLELNYGYSRSFRKFNSIDSGEKYPYKYDSPHNLSFQLNWNLDKSSLIILNFQYASGTAYTLYDIERLGADGQTILVPSSRNNFRLPAFHHLDVRYVKQRIIKSGILKFELGVYNIYNRQNAFYEYLREDLINSKPELVKISIFPIIPQFNLSYTW